MFIRRLHFTSLFSCTLVATAFAQQLDSVFPVGVATGTTQSVAFAGSKLEPLSDVRCNHPGVTFHRDADNRFTVRAAANTPAGLFDVQAVGPHGLSSTRAFFVSTQPHIVEAEPDSLDASAQDVPLGCVISGRIAKGDMDDYRFLAAKGDRVVIECWSERIDSSLRAVLELRDANEKQLAASRGYFGVDPVVTLAIPADGQYVARLYDLVYSGGDSHVYRLDISRGPRVVCAVPPVVQRGKPAQVKLYGWNLDQRSGEDIAAADDLLGGPLALESTTVQITAPDVSAIPPVRRRPPEMGVESFAYSYSGADVPTAIAVTDVPVAIARDNHSPETAQPLAIPGEVAGQLARGAQRDWFAIDVRRGEVLYLEAYGTRIGSPLDLDLAVLDAAGEIELATFHDELRNIGGLRFPTAHLDPAGRWVAPAEGRYLVMIRNLIGGVAEDDRRVYRLSLRREEPDVQLVAIAQGESPTGINLPPGGRTAVDILAFRRRGQNGSVRVSARSLPPGVTCPDIWLGPEVSSAPLVLSADASAESTQGSLELVGYASDTITESIIPVQSGTMIRGGTPNGSGRLMADLPVAIAGDAPVRITADGHEPREHHLYGALRVRHSPGSVLDVAVRVQRRAAGHAAPVTLTGVGIPELIANQTASIPAGEDKGYISFCLPHSLGVGTYTLAIRGETTAPIPGQDKTQDVVVYSNAVTFQVHPAAFRLDLDLQAPTKIKPGEVVQVGYSCRRINGFIGKIHTELAAPGKVTDVGHLRGRGVTSVGQTESGTIQIVANEDAEPGLLPFLRLYAVGVEEDEAIYHGSCFLKLEVVE